MFYNQYTPPTLPFTGLLSVENFSETKLS